MRARHGEAANWSADTYLLAAIVDHLGILAADMRWKKAPPFVRRPGQEIAPEPEPVSAIDVRAELEKRHASSRDRKRKKD